MSHEGASDGSTRSLRLVLDTSVASTEARSTSVASSSKASSASPDLPLSPDTTSLLAMSASSSPGNSSAPSMLIRVEKTDKAHDEPRVAHQHALKAIKAIGANQSVHIADASTSGDHLVTDANGSPVPLEVGAQGSAASDQVSFESGSIKSKVLEAVSVKTRPRLSNEEFHQKFVDVPADDELVDDYKCALQREHQLDGRLFVSERCLCFATRMNGWDIRLVIPWSEVSSVEKRTTALLIPNAIHVATEEASYLFTSLGRRDACYTLMKALWGHANRDSDAESVQSDPSEISYEDDEGDKKKFKLRNLPKVFKRKTSKDPGSNSAPISPAEEVKREAQKSHTRTVEECPSFESVAIEAELPVSPEQAYNLFFENKDFLVSVFQDELELQDVEIGEWQTTEDKDLRRRDVKYLKPLHSKVGPKEAMCYLEDAEEHKDPDHYFSIVVTTRTPDVPSGKNFCTKTRSAFAWTEKGTCHLRVTTQCEWTKVNRMLKGVIEKSSLEGQTDAQSKLVKAACKYIQDHRDEFGLDAEDAQECAPVSTPDHSTSSMLPSLNLPIVLAALATLILLFVIVRWTRRSTIPESRKLLHDYARFVSATKLTSNSRSNVSTQIMALSKSMEAIETTLESIRAQLVALAASDLESFA